MDWNLLPAIAPITALKKLRRACPAALVIVLISHWDSRQFISKTETPERMAERLQFVATGIHP